MNIELLTTKYHIPPSRPNLLPRPHLIEHLNQGLGDLGSTFTRKLTLVCAPAGFGKTTVVTEWASQMPAGHCAWLSLDDGDNDPTRFLTYFVAAMQGAHTKNATITPTGFGGAALALLQSPQTPPIESILAALINEIVAAADRFVLLLDDYHVIQTEAIHDILTFLLDHLPSQMHLVIVSRSEPPIPLARLRIRGDLTEIRLADLRFRPDETGALFNQLLGMGLSAEDIAALDARTEGWIAGLQVAALSMEGLKDFSGFISAFTGSHRYILDYLVEEVLDRQPEHIRSFLLRSSVLDRLSGPLCNEITGQDRSQEILEQLERANLFVIPLDHERRWYRYHHLFAELLRARLDQALPGEAPELHRRASAWFEENGQLAEAVRHGLFAEAYDRSAYLIEKLADLLWARGEPTTLLRWLESLPDESLFSRPRLCIHQAWALYINGHNQAAESRLEAAGRTLDEPVDLVLGGAALDPQPLSEAERTELRGRIAAIRASIAFRQGDFPGVFRHSEDAFNQLSEASHMWRCVTGIALGYAQDFSGSTGAAFETLTDAVSAAKASGNIYLVLNSGLHLGTILMLQGKLKEAYALGQELLHRARERGVLHTEMAGCLYDELGAVLCEWNEMDEATRHLDEGSKLSRQGYDVGVLGYSYLTMLRALFAQRDTSRAQRIIDEMEELERDADVPPWFKRPKEAWKARLWLMKGDVAAATSWADERGLSADGDLLYSNEDEHIVLARILLARDRLGEATRLLDRLLQQAESGGRIEKMIQILIVQAIAFQSLRRGEDALTALGRALHLAEPGGYVRLFLDEGSPMAQLLRQALAHDIEPNAASKLMAAFASENLESGTSSPPLPRRNWLNRSASGSRLYYDCWRPDSPIGRSPTNCTSRSTPLRPMPRTSTAS
jgi:LuxR family maltose regulon positive regulatory protein